MAPDLLTVIVASVSCLLLCLLILTLAVVLYRKDPLCCHVMTYRQEEFSEDPRFYHNRPSLLAVTSDPRRTSGHPALGAQVPGRIFVIGKPGHYHMGAPLPRLPTYESVRRKDRQRQIHRPTAQRFRLGAYEEPPPSYDETLLHSRQSEDIHLSPPPPSHHESSRGS